MDGNGSPPPTTDDNFALCAIPTTHRRLVDAHRLWHQSLDAYHDPDGFRANLNATLQGMRNVTFALQSEKANVRRFRLLVRALADSLGRRRSGDLGQGIAQPGRKAGGA